MKIKQFEEIESWKIARIIVNQIYEVTKNNNFSKDFALRDQIRRACISIMANIAEGFDSGTDKYFINFLNYAYRSASEVQSLLYISLDQKYLSKDKFCELYDNLNDVKNLIAGFIKYLKKRKLN